MASAYIFANFSKWDTCGVGLSSAIYRNGSVIGQMTLNATDPVGKSVAIPISGLANGDKIDFALIPGVDDYCDGSWFTAQLVAGPATSSGVADSVNDFGSSPSNGWSYGYFPGAALSGDFGTLATGQFSGLQWDSGQVRYDEIVASPPWDIVYQNGLHSSLRGGVPKYAVRRWTSSVTGLVQVNTRAAKADTSAGDGTTPMVFWNGVLQAKWPLHFNDSAGINGMLYLHVKPGDFLDFILYPGGADTVGAPTDINDSTLFTVSIATAPLSGTVINDSSTGYSGVQGGAVGGWQYGYGTSSGAFYQLPAYDAVSGNWSAQNGVVIGSAHTVPAVGADAVRRWVSNVTGPVTIHWQVASEGQSCGTGGFSGILRVNGVQQGLQYVQCGNVAGYALALDTVLSSGDLVDVVVSATSGVAHGATVRAFVTTRSDGAFSIVNPPAISLPLGQSVSVPLTLSPYLKTGTSSVTPALLNAPTGMSATFTPVSFVNGAAATTTMTLSAGAGSPVGAVSLSVSGAVLGVVVVAPPTVYLDSPVTVYGVAALTGYALVNDPGNPDHVGSVTVQVVSDEDPSLSFSVPATYGSARSDACSTYTGAAGCPNVGFQANWDSARNPAGGWLPNGMYKATVTARDAFGTQSAAVSVDFTVDNQAPEVYMISPLNATGVAGTSQVFSIGYASPHAGAADISGGQVVFQGPSASCAVNWSMNGTVTVFDPGNALVPAQSGVIGSGTITASMCTVSLSGSSIVSGGAAAPNQVTLNLAVSFASSQIGLVPVEAYGLDANGYGAAVLGALTTYTVTGTQFPTLLSGMLFGQTVSTYVIPSRGIRSTSPLHFEGVNGWRGNVTLTPISNANMQCGGVPHIPYVPGCFYMPQLSDQIFTSWRAPDPSAVTGPRPAPAFPTS